MADPARILNKLRDEVKAEIEEHLLPFWISKVIDNKNGGFHGRLLNDNSLIKNAPRSAVLNTRILWTFSAAYRILQEKKYSFVADRSYKYMMNHFWDDVHGGVYWMIDQQGNPVEAKKHVYAQAFAIYGLSEYYRATSDSTALTKAIDIYNLLIRHSLQPETSGYHEAFSKHWTPLDDVRLSEKDDKQLRSMNTHLHLFEAYANLYRVWPNEDLRRDLTSLIELFFGPIYSKRYHHFYSFFDEKWMPTTDVYSYGHDIETAWLLIDATRIIGDKDLINQSRDIGLKIAEVTLKEGIDEEWGGLYQGGKAGRVIDADKHWWAQAEAVVGFVYAYQEFNRIEFLEAAVGIWEFTKKYIKDPRYGEWFFRVNRSGDPYMDEDKVGPWKCPYHTVRMGLELLERVDAEEPIPGKEITRTK